MSLSKEQIEYELDKASKSYQAYLDKDKNQKIVERLQEYISYECNPSYDWSAKKVYDDLRKIIDPDCKPSRALELHEIQNYTGVKQ